MKKIILKHLIIGFAAIIGLSACSKQANSLTEDQTSGVSNSIPDDPKSYGAIEGMTIPWIKGTTVYATSNFYHSAVTTTDEFGHFAIVNLNPATYDVFITFEQFGLPVTIIIEAVDVKPLSINNIGIINLE